MSPRRDRTPTAPPQAPRTRARAWIAIAVVLAALPLVAVAATAIAGSVDARRFPPPGRLVEVEPGRRIHVIDTGPADAATVYVLEHGGMSTSAQWAHVQPVLAQDARVLAYDRAGMGWSDPLPGGRTPERMVADLAAVLDALDVRRPVVLVGHSYGGFVVRAFRDAHPERVAGMALLDSSHPDQVARLGADGDALVRFIDQAAVFPVLARVGLFRFLNPVDAQKAVDLPPDAMAALRAHAATARHWAATVAELQAWDSVAATARDAATLADLPLLVVTAEDHEFAPEGEHAMATLQRELVALSTDGRQVAVPGAHHNGVATHQAHAMVTVAALRSTFQGIESTSP